MESSTRLGGFTALKKTPEAPYTTKVNYRAVGPAVELPTQTHTVRAATQTTCIRAATRACQHVPRDADGSNTLPRHAA